MLHLKLFGGASLENDAGLVHGPAAQRRRIALLALLAASATQRVSRDRLIALLWPEEDTPRARHFLADSVYAIRSGLGRNSVLTIGDDLHLNPEIVRTDVIQFGDAVRSGERERAADLYAGPFLDGFFLTDAAEFEQWVEAERNRLSSLYARLLEELAEEREARNDFAGAVIWWRRLAACDRFSSRIALRLMQSLAAAGDSPVAIEHARIHETLLREELDTAPPTEILSLVERLQTAAARSGERSALQRAPVPEDRVTPSHPVAERVVSQSDPTVPRSAGKRRTMAVALLCLTILLAVAMLVRREASVSRPVIRALAVLPLENISGDPGQEYFANGMTEELTTALARYPELRVLSRVSATRVRGGPRSVAEIARQLGVDAIVEGSVFREQDRVRITARLVHAGTDQHLWAESYERDVRDVIGLQAEVARAIAREVNAVASDHVGDATRRIDPLAHELLLRGRYAASGRGRSALEQAEGYYRQAIERDSAYAEAYAALADVFRLFGVYAYRPIVETNADARALVERALQLDPRLAAAHALRAQFLADDFAWEPALDEFERALELDPGDALTRHRLAMTLGMMGRFADALREAQRTLALDPLLGQYRTSVAVLLQQVGRQDEAEQQCRTAVELDATDPWPHYFCGMVHLNAGRIEDALVALRKPQRMAPDHPMSLSAMAVAAVTQGDTTGARARLQSMLRDTLTSSPFHIAVVYAALGDHEAAFQWLEREPWIGQTKLMLRTHGVLDPLRVDERYDQLLHRLRLQR